MSSSVRPEVPAVRADLRDIGNIIVIGEVPESDMIKMLQDDWGMDADLAEMFYNCFGGDIYTTKQALESLIDALVLPGKHRKQG